MKKIALVTGAGRGIGRAIAARLMKEGFTVIANTKKTPIEETESLIGHYADITDETAVNAIKNSFATLFEYNEKSAEAIRLDEDKTDKYEDSLGSYLVKLSNENMSESDNHEVSKLLHMIGDFERIGDHATNIAEWVIFSVTGEHKNS